MPAVRRAERVAIVGGGPAGMSAAYYLSRLGYNVTVFEAMPVPGGMMAIGIPEYRLPRDVLREEIDRIVGLGVELKLDSAMGRDYTLADLEAKYDAIFLATGASRSRKLGVPGDGLPGVVPATLFLKQVNLGEKPVMAGFSPRLTCLRKRVAGTTPGRSSPGTPSLRLRDAPVARKTALYLDSRSARVKSRPMALSSLSSTPRPTIRSISSRMTVLGSRYSGT